ncbi:hypothetical protein E4U55_003399 [Claviceps digitariae]|nr:hypothetical protein E4U55_003399 [Claviceps digitariae]
MQVCHPRRILAVGLEGQAEWLGGFVRDLTGVKPSQEAASLAGTTHELALKTQYYTASVPIWLDLIASPSEWAASFLSEEAGEVLAVLGGVVLVFALPVPGSSSASASVELLRELIDQVGRVVNQGLGGWEWDGVRLAVGVAGGDVDVDAEEWDELCAEAGMEFVRVGGVQPARNEFGEKTGMARVKEALESNDWAEADAQDLSDFGDFNDGDENNKEHLDPENLDFGFDPADIEGLKRAIWGADAEDGAAGAAAEESEEQSCALGDSSLSASLRHNNDDDVGLDGVARTQEDKEVTKMEDMMRKLQAVREAGEGLPAAQRRRMAARAVQEVMREL